MNSNDGAVIKINKNIPAMGISEDLKSIDLNETIKYVTELGVKLIRISVNIEDVQSFIFPEVEDIEILPVISYQNILSEEGTDKQDKFISTLEIRLKEVPSNIKFIEVSFSHDLLDLRGMFNSSPEQIYQFITKAAKTVTRSGRKMILSSALISDPIFLELMCSNNTLKDILAVSIPFVESDPRYFKQLKETLHAVQKTLGRHNLKTETWLTETGYSTAGYDDYYQVQLMNELIQSGVKRIYWHSLHDKKPLNGNNHNDSGAYSGLLDYHRKPKLLYRIWKNSGIEGIANYGKNLNIDAISKNKINYNRGKPDLIIGGAGFIGTNLAHRLLSSGRNVRIFDNLSRPGVEQNLNWLCSKHGDKVEVEISDVRDKKKIERAVKDVSRAYHFAAQVAVTTSLDNPELDFEVNLRGTFNILEAIRSLSNPLPFIFTSTNKVYGGLEDLRFTKNGTRYIPEEYIKGIDETRSLDFHSPYGCSKGASDQYVLDYARSFKMLTTVFRMSCIYGPHQFGTEDQGWVAHFIIQAMKNEKIIIFGDGKQVRDLLYVDDLVDAFIAAHNNIQRVAGKVFNIGGGEENTISLIELLDRIFRITNIKPSISFAGWRMGDQKFYVSDISKFKKETGWIPKTSVGEGLKYLYEWLININSESTEMNKVFNSQIQNKIVA